MCGICGIFSPSGKLSITGEIITAMATALSHRGPDDWSSHVAKTIGLAHRRLSIIDLSDAGRQPMCNEDRSVWVTFNGEIYNFKELRPWLSKRGHRFRSNTDTEVILHLYEEQGEEFVKSLNGMFSLGLWDNRRERLILARDRLGVKPLVYFAAQDGLVFASEIKSLARHPQFPRKLDIEGLELFFTFNFIPAPWTIYDGVRKLPPASYLVADKRGTRTVRYWEIAGPEKLHGTSPGDMGEDLRNLIENATKIRLFSDVPVGVFLSGGIDSSIVTAAAARNTSGRLKTFCAGFPGSVFDERVYAQAVASMYGTEHTVLDINVEDSINDIEQILSSFDEPFGDSSALPTFLISRLTRRHVTVALSGDGGDEIFGGYRRYLAEQFIGHYLKIPGIIRDKCIQPFFRALPDSKDSRFLEILRRLKIFVAGANHNEAIRHYQWLAMFPDADRESTLLPSLTNGFSSHGVNLIAALRENKPLDRLNRMLFTDVSFLLPFDMLTKVDWMSMLNGLEVRSPLLDFRVAEMAFSIPGHLKFRNGSLKYLLKTSFKKWLPDTVLKRPKQGFEVPIGNWLRNSMRFQKLFWDTVHGPNPSDQRIFNHQAIESLMKEHCSRKRDNTHKLWAIMVFQWWYSKNVRQR